MPRSPSAQPKEQLTIRFAERWLSHLRKRAEELQVSMSDVVEEMVQDQFDWFKVPPDVADVLREDQKKSSKRTQRDYIVSLVMKRYQEIIIEQNAAQKLKK